MAELNTWYNRVLSGKSQPEYIFQLDIRSPKGNRLMITMADTIVVSDDFRDAESWVKVEKVEALVDEKISKGKPFVIKQIFSMMEKE